jgi:hypothetical protein
LKKRKCKNVKNMTLVKQSRNKRNGRRSNRNSRSNNPKIKELKLNHRLLFLQRQSQNKNPNKEMLSRVNPKRL